MPRTRAGVATPSHRSRPVAGSGRTLPAPPVDVPGLRYVTDAIPATAADAGVGVQLRGYAGADHPRSRASSRGSGRWRSRRPGPTCGSVHRRTGTCRPPAETPGAEAVPLSHALADPARSGGVRSPDGLRSRATTHPPETLRARPAQPGIPRDKVLAAVVLLLGSTLSPRRQRRVRRPPVASGCRRSRDQHAAVERQRIRFRFRVKAGRCTRSPLLDRRLARLVRRCQELPGQELFQYVDNGDDIRDVASQTSTTTCERLRWDVTPRTPHLGGHGPRVRALRGIDADGATRPAHHRTASATRPTARQHARGGPRQLRAPCHPRRLRRRVPGATVAEIAPLSAGAPRRPDRANPC